MIGNATVVYWRRYDGGVQETSKQIKAIIGCFFWISRRKVTLRKVADRSESIGCGRSIIAGHYREMRIVIMMAKAAIRRCVAVAMITRWD